jgi:hypothetical protein
MCVDLCALRVNALLTVHQRVLANRKDLEQLGVRLQSILLIISKYRKTAVYVHWITGLKILPVRSSVHACLTLMNPLQGHQP